MTHKNSKTSQAGTSAQLDPKFGQVVLFEDAIARSRRFLPITTLHSTHELRMGAFTVLERLQLVAGNLPIALHVRPELVEVTLERHGLPVNKLHRRKHALLLNSRVILDRALLHAINKLEPGVSLSSKSGLVAYFADASTVKDFGNITTPKKNLRTVRATLVQSIWEVMLGNSLAIQNDGELLEAHLLPYPSIEDKHSGVHVSNPENVLVGAGVRIGAGAVLDASEGRIVLKDGVRIMPNAVVIGPASIGEHSIVKIGAKIYSGTSIGPHCKIGGEVEKSVVLGYSNKQHDGYLGHSYLGEWVNLGADTNTSDLKNDYTSVALTIEGERFETGSLFVGLFMGDHSKCAINSQFNTGTVVGVSCNLFDQGFPPKWIPNFSWVGNAAIAQYKIDKAIGVARIVMRRRNKELTLAEEKLLRQVAHSS